MGENVVRRSAERWAFRPNALLRPPSCQSFRRVEGPQKMRTGYRLGDCCPTWVVTAEEAFARGDPGPLAPVTRHHDAVGAL